MTKPGPRFPPPRSPFGTPRPPPAVAERPSPRLPTAIERAGLTPRVLRTEASAGPDFGHGTSVALVHDGGEHGLLADLLKGMAEGLAGNDHALVVHMLGPALATDLHAFLTLHRPAGIVLAPALSARSDLRAVCAAAQIRVVGLGGGGDLHCDDRAAAAAMTGWLIQQGHARIGLVAGPEDVGAAQQRELGYLDAMADHGLDRGPALIVPGDLSFASGIEAGRLLLEISPRPTAILAVNDEMAAGVLHAAAQVGMAVPKALSVAGFDDSPLAARMLPPLTTMRVPWRAIAHEAARRAVGLPGHADAFVAERIVRDSVAPAGTGG